MFLNLANALIRLIVQPVGDYGVIEYIWISIGIASLMALFYLFFKISTAEKIPVDTVKCLKEKSFFGRKRYTFELKNGKRRHLGKFKNPYEFAAFRELLKTAGIPF
jgi:hypothetical protein